MIHEYDMYGTLFLYDWSDACVGIYIIWWMIITISCCLISEAIIFRNDFNLVNDMMMSEY